MAAAFSTRLLAWHARHGRKTLPWQRQVSPYRVWVSEIMLQQTQVMTVVPYFERFMERFPSVAALADAGLDEVLGLWSGLGYYARARNLYAAACVIRDDHGGKFPHDLDAVMNLPGIGRSTAGAILALAWGQRHPILDGNVKRVLSRHRGVEGWPGETRVASRLWSFAEALTPRAHTATYTQAMMDLGSLVCTRRRPRCDRCPVSGDCHARQNARQEDLPAPRPRRLRPIRQTMMLVIRGAAGEILLERRPPVGVWGGLLSFPEVDDETDARRWVERTFGQAPRAVTPWATRTHNFTHFQLRYTPLEAELDVSARGIAAPRVRESDRLVWYTEDQSQGGVAAPVKQIIERLARAPRGDTDGPNDTVRQAG